MDLKQTFSSTVSTEKTPQLFFHSLRSVPYKLQVLLRVCSFTTWRKQTAKRLIWLWVLLYETKRAISDIWLSAEVSLVLALSSPVYLKTPQWRVALNDSQSYLTGSMYATKSTPPTVRLAFTHSIEKSDVNLTAWFQPRGAKSKNSTTDVYFSAFLM